MTYRESLDYLYGLQVFGIKLGLENIRTFLSRLGHPEHRFKPVLVAGTNGKGSIAAALAGMLTRSGYRAGLYTSPHLHSFCERIRVDGATIPEDRVGGLISAMRPQAAGLNLTFFEFTTALALQFFAEAQVEIAVLEVGMGGRLDATNVVDPILSVIGQVASDHEAHLGNGIDRIAREKAGIMRSGVPVVMSAQEPVAAAVLADSARAIGAPQVTSPSDFNWTGRKERFDYFGLDVELHDLQPGIPGRHQFGNMATALAATEKLGGAGFPVSPAAMREGVSRLCWPGRLEWLVPGSILLDGAHNGAGAKALTAYLSEQGLENVHWIVGMKADKNYREILASLVPVCKRLYCVEPPVEDAVPAGEIQSAAIMMGAVAETGRTIQDALMQARESCGEKGIVLVAGSLFLVAAVRELLMQEETHRCDVPVC